MTKITEQNKSNIHTPVAVPLAIVGIGCLFPKANNPNEYWKNIREGVDAITNVPDSHWKPEDYFNEDKNVADMTYAMRGGFIDQVDFDPLLYGLSPNNIEATDTTQLLGMVVARQALIDAGYSTSSDNTDGRPFDRSRTSVILGVTGTLELVIPLGARLGHPHWRKALADAGVADDVAEEVVARIADSYVPWQENSFPGLLGNVAAGRIANRFDLGGTNCVVDAACASSLSAIHMAALELYSGRSDMAISGGFDTFNDIFMYMCFSKTPALSPTGNSRPFDINGDGTILGEGLGAIILKRLDDAKRDGDKIYAVLKGMGSSSDGRGNAIYAPSANGQTRALKNAYQDAGVTPGSIELVEAHGTGTRVGDAVEAQALSSVFREDRQDGTWCALGSVKSMIGHTKAAAGIAGLIKIAMALRHKVLPPTIKIERPLEILNPGNAPVYVNTHKRPWITNSDNPRRAGISAFGFGGSNFHCVLEEAEHAKPEIEWDGEVLMLGLSGKSVNAIEKGLNEIKTDLDWDELRYLAASSLQTFRHKDPCRLVMVITSSSNMQKLINDIREKLVDKDNKSWRLPEGAYFGSGKQAGKLAILFPGQGSQYPDMLLDLACQFPQMQSALSDANHCFAKTNSDQHLSNLIYPIPVFTDEQQIQNIERLRLTHNAQPAIGAISIGSYHILKHFGIKPDISAGHSFGELTALCAAGRFDSKSLFRLAIKRGELMQTGKDGENGSMLAVSASAAVLHEILEAEQLDLIIANNNAPSQVVLSGATDQIYRAVKVLEKRGMGARKLPVSAAFHSSFVADAEKPFAQFLDNVKFKVSKHPVFANSTSEVYPHETTGAKALLASQLARPVEFVSQIENMYADGVNTFIESGPGSVLTGLVRSILGEREFTAMAVDVSRGKNGQYDLACTLAQVAALGYKATLDLWDEGFARRYEQRSEITAAMTVSISGANYVKPRPKQEPVKKPLSVSNTLTNTIKPSSIQNSLQTNITGINEISHPLAESGDLLKSTQQAIIALQKMQQETSELHRQYLEAQETAQKSIHKLIERQQQLQTGNFDSQSITEHSPIQPSPRVKTETGKVPVAEVETPITKTENKQTIQTPEFESLLLEVVSEKTGYPIDMLSLEMSLDTDLGIDSIKRVEILSALQEKLPGAGKIQPEDLGTFRLLKHIAEFMVANTYNSPAESTPTPVEIEPQASSKLVFETMLFEVVSDKTGYPVDMLNLEMNLDTDLGIDSIKRVEILSAFQEKMPEAPSINPDDLAKLQTLQQIVAFMQTSISEPAPATVKHTGMTINPLDVGLIQALLEVVADKTGYPVDMLNLEMNLDTDLGIDSIKRVEILSAFQERIPEAPAINPDDLTALQTLQQIVDYMSHENSPPVHSHEMKPETKIHKHTNEVWRGVVEAVAIKHERQQMQLPSHGLIGVTDDGSGLSDHVCLALETQGLQCCKLVIADRQQTGLAGLVIVVPARFDDSYIADVFELIQYHAVSLQEINPPQSGLLACITGLGGNFGIDSLTEVDPRCAAIGGLIKTADKECPNLNCRSIDVDYTTAAFEDLAVDIADELLFTSPLETGLFNKQRYHIQLTPVPVSKSNIGSDRLINSNETLVISGGARGITAEIASELARTYKVNLLLLGRSPAPQAEPMWLRGLTEESSIKQALVQNNNDAQTPKAVEEKYRQTMANREILENLKRIEAEGVRVSYQSVDIRNKADVAQAIYEARKELGPVTGVIHGAGVLADKLLVDKTREQFDDVFSTKVDGLNALLDATRDDDLKMLVMFSSSTGRFGRKGQSDYAAANEVLNKIAQQQAILRPACRVLSMNWGPWDGGMVTPQLRKLFESEGVGVIPLAAGSKHLVRELAADGNVEIVILGTEPVAQFRPSQQLVDQDIPSRNTDMHVAFERMINIEDFPVLNSHIMNGKAVLPVALIMEWFAHGAVHNNPGLVFKGVKDLRVFKGVILEADSQINVQILAGNTQEIDGKLQVPVELVQGKVLHAGASIIVGTDYDEEEQARINGLEGQYSQTADEVYNSGVLFHGEILQGISKINNCSDQGISGNAKPAPHPSLWMQHPIRTGWITDPLVIDAAFQLMILWCFENLEAGSLPTGVCHYHQFHRSFPKDEVEINIQIESRSKHEVHAMIEFMNKEGQLIARIDGYECVVDALLNEAFRHNQLVGEIQ